MGVVLGKAAKLENPGRLAPVIAKLESGETKLFAYSRGQD